jgi:hypothetical protein
MERDMVRDLNREKTLGATDAPAACLPRHPSRLKIGHPAGARCKG